MSKGNIDDNLSLNSDIVVFKPSMGETEYEVIIDKNAETVWATELQIAQIFDRDRTVINKHIRNIFNEGELSEVSTSAKIALVRKEGDREIVRDVIHYNLDIIISVGYRVKSNLASELFGNEKDDSFKGILGSISQTAFGELAYPTVEEQSAQLLYSIIKGHAFTDGNKRIGSFMFVWFLEQNKFHNTKEGKRKIDDKTLVSLALVVAQSLPEQREIILKLIINLIKN